MELRLLELKDAPLMLEWMHDDNVIKDMQANFKAKKISDCETFILNSKDDNHNLNLAIVDENDEYMGTVSLKHIKDNHAEFAITIRTSAMGKGYSTFAINEIIKIGFSKLKLKTIYWYVSKENKRAIKFYDKNNFEKISFSNLKISLLDVPRNKDDYLWYRVINKV